MNSVIEFKPRPVLQFGPTPENGLRTGGVPLESLHNEIGGCPECGRTDGFMNVERDHWAVCVQHKTKWRVGRGLFSEWEDETQSDWTRNEYRLAHYREVQPV